MTCITKTQNEIISAGKGGSNSIMKKMYDERLAVEENPGPSVAQNKDELNENTLESLE